MTTDQATGAQVKLLTGGMRWLLYVAGGLVFLVGVPLFVLSRQTGQFFAWTINPPLTAAFLGGAYWSSFALEFLCARRKTWARARLAVPAVLIFTALTLAATLLHLDKFHFGPDFDFITRAGTWVWLGVYVSVPPLMLAMLAWQLRAPGGDPPRAAPLPAWLRAVVSGQGLVMLAAGLALFFAPAVAGPFWPWALSALTARSIGAWLVGLGVAAGHIAWENDWTRVGPGMAGYAVFGALELAALARFALDRAPDTGALIVRWGAASAWLYLLFVLSVLAVGLYGLFASRRAAGD